MKPLWNLLALIEHFFINAEIPSGPKPSMIFISKNFHKNSPIFFDGTIIDGFGPDGISSFIKKCSIKANKFQSGFIYQYAFVMLVGFSAFLTFLIVR